MKKTLLLLLLLLSFMACTKDYQHNTRELMITCLFDKPAETDTISKHSMNENPVLFYPNPFVEMVLMASNQPVKEIVITNSKGDYKKTIVTETTYGFDFSMENDGVYYAEVLLTNNELFRFYLIKSQN